MPVGFIFLGLTLIYLLFFENNITIKWIGSVFCFFTMCGYFVSPINLCGVSANIIFVVASICMVCCFSFSLTLNQKVNVLIWSVFVSLAYVVLSTINSDYITALNPYPVCFIILILCVINLKNFNFVVSFVQLSFLIINACNLVVERGMGHINIASVEFFNLMIVMVFIIKLIMLCITNFKILKRSRQWKRVFYGLLV